MFVSKLQLLRYLFGGLLSFIIFSAQGQIKLDGIYRRYDTLGQGSSFINEMTVTVKGDSIWFDKNNNRVTIHPSGTRNTFFSYKGTIRKYKHFYLGDLILMECDTCPAFWKYTTKTEDSVGIEVLFHSDKIDTLINNGDTSYHQAEILSDKAGNVEVRRMKEIFFTVANTGELSVDGKLYRQRSTN